LNLISLGCVKTLTTTVIQLMTLSRDSTCVSKYHHDSQSKVFVINFWQAEVSSYTINLGFLRDLELTSDLGTTPLMSFCITHESLVPITFGASSNTNPKVAKSILMHLVGSSGTDLCVVLLKCTAIAPSVGNPLITFFSMRASLV